MIRLCETRDFDAIWSIINDAANAYKGVIPADRWHEPYMPKADLQHEIDDGVGFWGYEQEGVLVGVMGIQEIHDVTLIRHAYVRTSVQARGIGRQLLTQLRKLARCPLLIGTWADATWAIRFYEKNGFQLVLGHEKDELLAKYWTIPHRQVETSVVLASPEWLQRSGNS
ncbi:MAG TPA: GNAT family N-acetyltransferase [Terriglobales bacterium]|nr:GNAT family N-acetyltransferase [Terriglobales bacterium]